LEFNSIFHFFSPLIFFAQFIFFNLILLRCVDLKLSLITYFGLLEIKADIHAFIFQNYFGLYIFFCFSISFFSLKILCFDLFFFSHFTTWVWRRKRDLLRKRYVSEILVTKKNRSKFDVDIFLLIKWISLRCYLVFICEKRKNILKLREIYQKEKKRFVRLTHPSLGT
jgi:hypothetical protein